MKKFIILYHGELEATRSNSSSWNNWFREVAEDIIEIGGHFHNGIEV